MALSLLEAIHRRWAATAPLCALLPAARVATGHSATATVPLAVVGKQSDRPLAACNDGSAVDAVGVRIQVFHGNHDAAAAIVAEIRAAFDRADFALDDGNKVINMQRTDDSEEQQDDGVWRMVVDFACTVHLEPRSHQE